MRWIRKCYEDESKYTLIYNSENCDSAVSIRLSKSNTNSFRYLSLSFRSSVWKKNLKMKQSPISAIVKDIVICNVI